MENDIKAACDEPALASLETVPPELTTTLGMIGGKWKLIILWRLSREDLRFSQLRRAIPRITQHMLTAHLRELEADGLITRTAYAEVPPRVVYAITDHGKSLEPVMQVLYDWGVGHLAWLKSRPPRTLSSPPSERRGQA